MSTTSAQRIAIPSEMLEPLLSEVLSWGLRDLTAANFTDQAWRDFEMQVEALDRLCICNRSDLVSNDPTGLHASLAMNTPMGILLRVKSDPKARKQAEDILRSLAPEHGIRIAA